MHSRIDKSQVGRSFAPVTARVEGGRLRYFLNTLQERSPVFRDRAAAEKAGYADIPTPPTYLFCLEMMDSDDPFEFLTALGVDLTRILHGEQAFKYYAPVVVGDAVMFKTSITGITDKKGGAMTLIVSETSVTNQHGVHVADISRTVVVRNSEAGHG